MSRQLVQRKEVVAGVVHPACEWSSALEGTTTSVGTTIGRWSSRENRPPRVSHRATTA